MAFPVVASSNTGSRTQISGTNCNVPAPTGVTAGDHLVMLMSASSVTPALVAVGWTTLYSSGAYAVQWKTADSGDAAASNFPVASFAGSSNTESCEHVILRITGNDPTTPFNVTPSFTTGSTTSPSGTGITPVSVQCLLLDVVMHQASSARTVSAYAIASNNPSWTEAQDANSAGSAGSNFSGAAVAWANETAAAGVATGNVSATISGAVTSNLIGIIAIQPSVFTASSSSSTTVVNTPAFVLKIVLAASVVASTTIGTVITTVAGIWANLAKHASSFTNLDKS